MKDAKVWILSKVQIKFIELRAYRLIIEVCYLFTT